MTSYGGYDHMGSAQYFTLNSYIYAIQTGDTSIPPWVARYREPLKLELKATSNMTLEQVLMRNLPDLNVAQCHLFVSQTQYRGPGGLGPAGREGKREADKGELAIRQRDKVLLVQLTVPLTGDTRHSLLVSLLEREDRTLESLQNIYGLLESIELVEVEYRVFTPLRNLIELISSFNSDLRNKVRDTWDPLWVQIGDLFLSIQSLWSKHYTTYFRSYKDMSGFVDAKRRNTFTLPGNSEKDRNVAYRLDSVYRRIDEILSIPFDQVDYCENILHSILMEHTAYNHPDRDKLYRAHQLVRDTLQIAKNEKQACDNERALKLVQDKFHNEIMLLYSKNPLETFQAFKKITPNSVFPPRSRLRPQLSRHREESQTSDTSRTTTQSSEMFAPPPRTLIKEGSFSLVHTQSPHNKHERYLILLTDILILAKPTHHHKTTSSQVAHATPSLSLKQLIPLQFVWTCDTLENGLEAYSDKGFLIGWPAESSGVNNFVAIFDRAEERRQWLDTINNTIDKAQQDLPPVKVSVDVLTDPPKIFSKEVPYTTQSCHLQEDTFVSLSNQATRQYLTRDNFAFLLVVKETQQYPLSGFESVAAIKSYYSHLASWRKGHQTATTDSGWCYFQMKQLTTEEQHGGIRKRFLSQFHFKKPRYIHPLQDQINDTPGILFHLPLDTIMPPPNHNIPSVLKCILVKLYRFAPGQQGIFRVEGSNKDVTELKNRVNAGGTVDWEECRVVVVGNLFKRFLRSIPGCLLPSSKYTEFAATNDIKEEEERVERIKRILAKIPLPNYKLSQLVFFMLSEVALNVAQNQMTPFNLGIAVGPSILQPMEGLSVYQLEMHEIVAFIVQHCKQIYGRDTPDIFTLSPSKQNLQLVPVSDGNSPKGQLARGDSNDSMEFDQKSFDSAESDTVTTPTNESHVPLGGARYRRDSKRSRFNSENDIQRGEQNRTNEKQVFKKNISIEITESPNNQSKSTPSSPEPGRGTATKLDIPPGEKLSHSSPNSPEAPRATFRLHTEQSLSSDEERNNQSNRYYRQSPAFTSPLYFKQKAANQLSSPMAPNNYSMASHNYQEPNYYTNPPKYAPHSYTQVPGNQYGMQTSPRVTGVSNSFPREVSQNNVRNKPGSLPRSAASYELTYPIAYRDTLPTDHTARHGPMSRSFDETGRLANVLPLCIQKAKAVIVSFPVIQDAQLAKISDVRPLADVSRV